VSETPYLTIDLARVRQNFHDLRAAFPGGDTLALDRPGPAIALVQATEDFTFRFTSLRRAIRAALGTEVRMLKLPTQPEDAERLLDGLAH